MENVDVARYMLINQGSDRGSFIVDMRAHNQHRVSSALNKDLFDFLVSGNLDSLDE